MIKSYSDHAANERTFLAWIRTGIAVIAFGFVVEKFNLFLLTPASSSFLFALGAGRGLAHPKLNGRQQRCGREQHSQPSGHSAPDRQLLIGHEVEVLKRTG
jgi:hypothetical protein